MDRAERQGFTLIEFVVAAALLGIVVVAVAAGLDSVKAINNSANSLTIATQLAQQEMELYRNTPYNNIAVGSQNVSSILSPYPALLSPRSATVNVTQVGSEAIKQVDITINYTGSGGSKQVEVTTQIADKGLNP